MKHLAPWLILVTSCARDADHAFLHDEYEVLRGLNAGQRVTGHGHNIGIFSRLQRSGLIGARESMTTIARSATWKNLWSSGLRGMGVLLVMAILVIYMVLGILYESFIHPFTILSGLPSAGLGALATLLIFHNELNIYSFLGIIMLIGIVKKNAIMMIDFALEVQHTQGISPAEAIHEACLVRFRPIMMTTMSALMGTFPIALDRKSTRLNSSHLVIS